VPVGVVEINNLGRNKSLSITEADLAGSAGGGAEIERIGVPLVHFFSHTESTLHVRCS
jgi:hypothetical protein